MAKFRKGFYKGWLTDKALLELRQDIILDSVFVSDYENRFNIDPKQVCDFFDGYGDYLQVLMNEDGKDGDNNYFALRSQYDNDTNLLAWYGCFEIDNNPFTKFVESEKFDRYKFAQIMAGCY